MTTGAQTTSDRQADQGTTCDTSTQHMVFDLTPFKAFKDQNVRTTCHKMLSIGVNQRSDVQINMTLHVLQTFSKFAAYPKHVQKSICKRAWHARFDRTRVLVRQGHEAEVYYFILSGIAVSRAIGGNDPEETRRRDRATFLRKGDVIGEMEILSTLPRQSTIICKEPMDVLGLDREDFLDIFRSEETVQCLDYLKTINELSDFPLDLLQAYDISCKIHNYRRGSVIVRNSSMSDWVYVIKSGSCQVYKAIKPCQDKENRQQQYLNQNDDGDLAMPDNVAPQYTTSVRDTRKQLNPWNYGGKVKHARMTSSSTPCLPEINPDLKSLVTGEYSGPNVKQLCHSDSQEPVSDWKVRGRKLNATSAGLRTTRYAKLELLSQWETFGLQSLIYEHTPSLTLVSNGAECILISKQFLLGHLNPSTLEKLRRKVRPYPSLGDLQGTLEDELMWNVYRQNLVRGSLN